MEQRRTRRFQLQLPLSVTRSGATRVELAGRTRNISSSGVLFTMEREPELGGPIEYVITLTRDDAQVVNLRCMGKIVRTGRVDPDQDEALPAFRIAATLERYEFVRDR
jgi:PilZ domain